MQLEVIEEVEEKADKSQVPLKMTQLLQVALLLIDTGIIIKLQEVFRARNKRMRRRR